MGKQSPRLNFFVLLLLAPSLACATVSRLIPPTPIDDVEPLPVTPLPSATIDPNEPPRWIEFERALASILLGQAGNTVPDLSRDQGLCEWEFWGQKGEQVYVWAECQNDAGTATSSPAVIFLSKDGHIKAVVLPEEGWGNLEQLFPKQVLLLIHENKFDAVAAMKHIELRRKDPSIRPLIIEQGAVMPLP